MANEEQLALLKSGVRGWNEWRRGHFKDYDAGLSSTYLEVDLRRANLRRANLRGANLNLVDLSDANLSGANLREADLSGANLKGAYLEKANLLGAYLYDANLNGANLKQANLDQAELSDAELQNANLESADLGAADLSGANLTNAILVGANLVTSNLEKANLNGTDLSFAVLVGTKVNGAKLSGSSVYGTSVWDLDGAFEEQKDLKITFDDDPVITVDNIKVAQFIYLILNNEDIREVINTLTSKSVLILGRFAIPERKAILDALRNKLREYDLLPIVFDFDRPADKDFTETIKTLAGISYFVIADITNPKSSPLELQATVPDYQIPFVPIIQEGEQPFSMMVDLQNKYPWVLPTKSYDSIETLMSALKPGIIDPAVEMRNKLRIIKAQEHPTESLKDYLDKTL